MASASTAYTSAAVNRHSYAASICSSQVAFGSSTYVALWDVEDPTDRGVYQTLPGHEGLITAIRFLQDGSFISADDEGFLSHWTKSDDKWTRLNTISAHKNAISSLAVHQSCIVSGASDSQVKVWNLTEDAVFLTPTRFISIADEKVARVFEAPKEFVTSIATLHVADLAQDQSERPRAATVPPLGLSNKATVETAQEELPKSERSDRRPFEGELAVATLWPEIEKVFGHGYESIALAASNNKQLVATACKATSADHAVVRVYDTTKWQIVGEPLTGHTLTITKIAFSPDDKYILSVSRDRTWRLFKRAAAEGGYHPIVADKSHARIIWDCDWAHEGDIFATASRDKSIKIWSLENLGSQKWTAAATIKLQEAATAVAFSAEDSDARRRMAVGLENGEILVFSGSRTNLAEWTEDLRLDARYVQISP
ncbi:hypothetical protein EUX98_g382 [Antrodiella citrinella]|uniref:Elongator complex protein 2 n=1 Tax=Antrodiella citrinella TaxID=2447956 RepID=A0A4S4N402_9APHY|nr:hypothetical protein EUX98_g382 [Antrodiella citrinella]